MGPESSQLKTANDSSSVEIAKPVQVSTRCVWRPVLDSAFLVPWPVLTEVHATTVLEGLVELLSKYTTRGLVSHQATRGNAVKQNDDSRTKIEPSEQDRRSSASSPAALKYHTQPMDFNRVPTTINFQSPKDRQGDPTCDAKQSQLANFAPQMDIDTTAEPLASLKSLSTVAGQSLSSAASAHKVIVSDSLERSETHNKRTKPDGKPAFEIQKPKLQEHVLLGIKSITQMLEFRIRDPKHPIRQNGLTPDEAATDVRNELTTPMKGAHRWKCIFVCREDLNPASLVDHLPFTVASVNDRQLLAKFPSGSDLIEKQSVYLIALPRGSDAKLSETLGIRHTAALAISDSAPGLVHLVTLFHGLLKPPSAPWLSSSISTEPGPLQMPNHFLTERAWIPTHIKHYKSSVPLDMKKAKLDKAKRRQQKKLDRRQSHLLNTRKLDGPSPGTTDKSRS
ncbi:hypothetical protein CROQUDRAFT_674234 [Cronartium quercuum f. sp. fusiforme G11]|uniref:Uncharacterized protein n=1 Tax=Cronartium quercuum f. sp. fusiforme G11 TaxID=708437 RepID=A0A9P6T882_9BASI|nr:hypothetical protein CROQUDRAFT_674234 [Cronartium quercuum f. sp. fusiforme G11]